MKFLCDNCKAKYQIADEKVAGKTVRMKCRKCGHQIEVRAAVTETSVAGPAPRQEAPNVPAKSSLATSLSAAPRPPARASQPQTGGGGALAGAFQRTVQDSASSPSFAPGASMSVELSVTDEWYVAINGVPVGPVRISELRRKAAAGAVTEDSLCWQEGLEEWRPVRSIPELAALVREAMQGNRPSLVAPPPPAEPRRSAPPPPPRRQETPRPPAPAPRSNVVPFHARVAAVSTPDDGGFAPPTPVGPAGGAAAAFAPSVAPAPLVSPFAVPEAAPAPAAAPVPTPPPPPVIASPFAPPVAVAADPFASAPIAPVSPVSPASPAAAPPGTPSVVPPAPAYVLASEQRRGVPLWFWPILAIALSFGGGMAYLVFRQPPPQPVVIQMPPTAAPTTPTAAPKEDVPAAPSGEAATSPSASGSAKPAAVAAAGKPVASPQAASTERKTADLGNLLGGTGGPTAGPAGGGGAGASGGGGLDQASVERVVATHRNGVKRTCWERGGVDQKSSVNVTITANVAPNGTVASTSSSGDDPVVAKCIESQVKTWTFPAPGEPKTLQLPFKFVRQ